MARRAWPRSGVRTRLPVAVRRAKQADQYTALRVGLVAYWPLNEDASSGDVTAVDWTGRGNSITSNNSVPSVTGKINNGREFNAANSEYLAAAGANNDLKFADGRDWTLCGWVWIPTWTTGRHLLANDSASNREIVFDTRAQNGNNLACQLNPGGAAGGTVFAGANLATSTWHFFCFQYTHSTGTLGGRVNASAMATATRAAGTLVQSANPLNIGRRQFTGANDHFTGYLDEVAKWDRVLSTREIDTLYNSGNGIDLRL